MPRYEVRNRLSNGRKKPHAVGSIVEMAIEDAADLVAGGSLRALIGDETEATGAPVGTAQRVTAAGTAEAPLNFVTASAAMRDELGGMSHKELDEIIKDEVVGEIVHEGSKPTIAEKVAGIAAHRSGRLLDRLNRGGLLDLAAASGYADVAALELAEDAAEDEVRAALMRVAAARVD